ncbi:hypothetical protein D3C83_225230 [compost metagenome]
MQRSTCGAVSSAGTWTKVAAGSATPGTGAITTCGHGLFISENSDAIGTGNYIYEFVEIFNDN